MTAPLLLPLLCLALICALRCSICLAQRRRQPAEAAYARALLGLRAGLALLQATLAGLLLLLASHPALQQRLNASALHLFAGLCAGALLLWLTEPLGAAFKSFVIDQRYGFNRMSAEDFVRDTAIQLSMRLVSIIVLAGLAALWLRWNPALAWLGWLACACPLASAAQQAYRGWIEPRLTPQGPVRPALLQQRFATLCRKTGLARARIVEVRASARSSHANARASRLLRTPLVLIHDTLIARLGADQSEAVLAHELGHVALGHLRRYFLLQCALWAAAVGLASALAPPAATQAAAHALTVLALAPSLRFVLQPVVLLQLRHWEFEADAFAARVTPPAHLAAALRSLFTVNAAARASSPWFRVFFETHPPLDQRLARLLHAHGD